jgi:ribonuclease HI
VAELQERGVHRSLLIHTDATARGNPGEAGIGVVITDSDGKIVKEFGRFIGTTTEHVAAYSALIESLRAAAGLGAEEIHVQAASELVVRQVTGSQEVRQGGLQPLLIEARRLLLRFRRWSIQVLPRDASRRPGELANISIDRQRNK